MSEDREPPADQPIEAALPVDDLHAQALRCLKKKREFTST